MLELILFSWIFRLFDGLQQDSPSCSKLKRVTKKQLHPPLQSISSEQLFPGDMMQIDLVGPFQSPVYKYVLSGIDVFSKYLFAVP